NYFEKILHITSLKYLFYSSFLGRAVLEILTYNVYAPVSARCPALHWLQQVRPLDQVPGVT
ncbi:hypothetical protein EU865_00640, partial [Salmonella enterica subsp. enterica serovar Ago]|nr:hypothetical protein [Salmonella enterica subsp. enterica serovar Ago]MCO9960094.1 hypothetical protein [Salmonella enterica subsp. enterica serovar Mbandaka]MHZ75884.1 hypothetical protein [Salmonella enterica subsp. enterica serovar Agona]